MVYISSRSKFLGDSKSGHETARPIQARPKKAKISSGLKFSGDSKSGHETARFTQARPKRVIMYVIYHLG